MSTSAHLTTITTYLVLASASGLAMMLPDALPQVRATGGDATTVVLTGVVRDFRSAHPDFAIVPAGGYGHYAGNVAEQLDVRGLPVLKDGEPITNFEIDNSLVVPLEAFALEVRLLGAAIENDFYDLPVTVRVEVGDDVTVPFGAFENAVTGNVNDDQSITGNANPGTNPRVQIIGTRYEAGTPVLVSVRSWTHDPGGADGGSYTNPDNWDIDREVRSDDRSGQLRVLRNGDPVPAIDGSYDQGNVQAFVADYVSDDGATMVLGDNQVIYLYELGVSGSHSDADFQDLVVLVSFATSAGYFDPDAVYGEGGGGVGYKVEAQWTDETGNPIAPHLYAPASGGDSRLIDAPIRDSEDDVEQRGDGSVSLTSSDLELIEDGADAQLVGLRFRDLAIPAGATIDAAHIQFQVAETGSGPSALMIRGEATGHSTPFTSSSYDVSSRTLTAASAAWAPGAWPTVGAAGAEQRTSDLSAVVQEVVDRADWTSGNAIAFVFSGSGARIAESLEGSTAGAPLLHVEYTEPVTGLVACGEQIADAAGTAGAASDGGISSAETFDQWFSDHPGVNLSANHEIVLEQGGDGVWEFTTNAFHPVDDRLFMNEGEPHNRNFTYAIRAEFVYDECEGQFLEFEGTDDAWTFVAGELVMDLGGVQPGTRQYVDMDRLGLVDGEAYQLHFFHAQRGAGADFSLRTNIFLTTPIGNTVVTSTFD